MRSGEVHFDEKYQKLIIFLIPSLFATFKYIFDLHFYRKSENKKLFVSFQM
jgi:hypothetical protein